MLIKRSYSQTDIRITKIWRMDNTVIRKDRKRKPYLNIGEVPVLRRGVPAGRVLLAPGGRHYITTQGQHTWSSTRLPKQDTQPNSASQNRFKKSWRKVFGIRIGLQRPKVQRTEINTVKLEASRFIEKIFLRKWLYPSMRSTDHLIHKNQSTKFKPQVQKKKKSRTGGITVCKWRQV